MVVETGTAAPDAGTSASIAENLKSLELGGLTSPGAREGDLPKVYPAGNREKKGERGGKVRPFPNKQ